MPRDISKEAICKAFREKGLIPRQGQYGLRIIWNADYSGGTFKAYKECCAISALVDGERLTQAATAAASAGVGNTAATATAARVQLGLDFDTRDNLVLDFDSPDGMFQEIVECVSKPNCSGE